MLEQNKIIASVKKWFSSDIKLKVIVILGLSGMSLILLSQFIGNKDSPKKSTDVSTAQFTSANYADELESRLTSLISGMDGVGVAKVMITLENEGETVYAQEETRNVDKQQEAGNTNEVGKLYQKENVEQKYIIVEGKNGQREALVKTRLGPRIQGVVVLCEGAGKPKIDQSITHVVTTALNITTTRVCVVKISKLNQEDIFQ